MIVNLQQDKDMQYWGVDFEANQRSCGELGLQLIRKPVSWPLLAALHLYRTDVYQASCLEQHTTASHVTGDWSAN